jgi:hypothetical protein
LTLFSAFALGSYGVAELLLPLAGFLAVRMRTRAARSMLLAAVFVLSALAARLVGLRVNWSTPLLSWNWPLTFLLVTLAVGLASLECRRRAAHERLFSGQWGKLWLSLLPLASNVVLFDLFLGVSSVVVFNTCTLACRVL